MGMRSRVGPYRAHRRNRSQHSALRSVWWQNLQILPTRLSRCTCLRYCPQSLPETLVCRTAGWRLDVTSTLYHACALCCLFNLVRISTAVATLVRSIFSASRCYLHGPKRMVYKSGRRYTRAYCEAHANSGCMSSVPKRTSIDWHLKKGLSGKAPSPVAWRTSEPWCPSALGACRRLRASVCESLLPPCAPKFSLFKVGCRQIVVQLQIRRPKAQAETSQGPCPQ